MANEALDGLGYIYHCEHCLYRDSGRGLIANPPSSCPCCGYGIQTAGPVWLEASCERAFVGSVRDSLSDDMGTASKAADLLDVLRGELSVPTHYDQHRLCKRWNRSAPAMETFLGQLREAGHKASRTHYGGTTFKTTADVDEIQEATGD